MKETFHANNPRSMWMRTHAQTAGWTLTAQQPQNNVVRVALQALAAVLGGTQSLHTNSLDEAWALPSVDAALLALRTQSLHTNSLDEAWALPSVDAALLALRTQQIIAHETGITDTIDPLGGSYYLETLTSQVEEGAYGYFRRIEDVGGVMNAIETGFLQREIADASYRYQLEADRKERVTVGVNEYVSEETPNIPLLRVDRTGEEHHVRRLNEVRRRRDGRDVQEKLTALEQAARSSQNTMPHLVEAAKAYATLGEMMDVFREVFGEYRPSWGY
jgi:methylmalonyl-CoA mutase N-terminal domain/subunit